MSTQEQVKIFDNELAIPHTCYNTMTNSLTKEVAKFAEISSNFDFEQK